MDRNGSRLALVLLAPLVAFMLSIGGVVGGMTLFAVGYMSANPFGGAASGGDPAAGDVATGIRPGAVPSDLAALYTKAARSANCSTVTPVLLAAQGKIESGFNRRAVSRVGAMGIAQFMPGTWATQGVDGDGDGTKDVWNPADAIPAQARYDCALFRQVGRLPGDPVALMLSAYNAGGYAVLRHGGVLRSTLPYIRHILATEKSLGVVGNVSVAIPPGVLGRMITLALSRQGGPYRFGAAGPRAFDCSGLVLWALKEAGGPTLPHSSEDQYAMLPHITAAEARPGDLVFFNPGEFVPGKPGHVGIYLGNGRFVGAQSSHRPIGRQITTDKVAGFGTIGPRGWVGYARVTLP